MKKCKCCNILKSSDNYSPNNRMKLGIVSVCKSCVALKAKQYSLKRKEERSKFASFTCPCCNINKSITEFTTNLAKCKRCSKNALLKLNFNITIDEYEKLLISQNYCCAICKRHESHFKTTLCVDHNHTTGQIRKLLCFNCNSVIGHCREDIEILNSTIDYLKEFS